MRRMLCLVLALLPLACAQTPPFDPGTDCPKETYCGQCASRGGCAWCGDPSDGSRGQCVAVGKAECAAPNDWAKTPDHCAPPPADAGGPAPTASASPPGPSPAEKALGPEKYNAIRNALKQAFPGAEVNDQVILGVAEVLRTRHTGPVASPAAGVPAIEKAPLSKHVHEKDHRLYLGQADHHRVRSAPPAAQPMQSEFMLALPMVRVSLPDKLTKDNATISTEIGDVDLVNDHLLGSIDLINEKYGGAEYLAERPARVDLITPARAAGSRFGAIAVYLGYRKKTDRGPSFYLLEAGAATGAAKMIYFSPDMKPITNATSYYLPTPFVSMRNTYTGGITMKPAPSEDEPDRLIVESRVPGEKDPYITVTVTYQRTPELDLPLPVEILADAGARVSLIAQTMGMPNAEELEGVLAQLGKTFPWIEYPRYVAPTAPSASASAAPATPH